MNQKRYQALLDDCRKIESRDNRNAVDNIIDSARVNADDTIRDEKLPDDKWDHFFKETIVSILCDGTHNRHVVSFFSKRGINA